MTITATLISEVFSTLTDKQRETLLKAIEDLIETVDNVKGRRYIASQCQAHMFKGCINALPLSFCT